MNDKFYREIAKQTGSQDAEFEKVVLSNAFSELSVRTGQSEQQVVHNLSLNNLWDDDVHPHHVCGSAGVMQFILQENPELEDIWLKQKAVIANKFFEIREEEVSEEVAKINEWTVVGGTEPPWSPAKGNDDVLRICCVVSVCVPGIESNPGLVSDAAITAQINQMNEHFRNNNPRGGQFATGSRWAARDSGDTKIEFYWVPGDTNTRRNKNFSSGTAIGIYNDNGKHMKTSEGGIDPADPSKYCNIYIVDGNLSNGGPAGWASGPSVGNPTDGMTCLWQAWVGNPCRNNAAGVFTGPGANTMVHEAGHYLGLPHTWGPEKVGVDQCVLDDYGIADNAASRWTRYGRGVHG